MLKLGSANFPPLFYHLILIDLFLNVAGYNSPKLSLPADFTRYTKRKGS